MRCSLLTVALIFSALPAAAEELPTATTAQTSTAPSLLAPLEAPRSSAAPDAGAPDASPAALATSPKAEEALPERILIPTERALAEAESDLATALRRLALAVGLGLLLFGVLRLTSRALRRMLGERRRSAILLRRFWPLLEGIVWAVFAISATAQILGRRTELVMVGLGVLAALAVASSWGLFRDVAAGLVFAAEQPFGVGDVVRIGAVQGQVRRLKLRVIEIETPDGRRHFVPYRRALATSDVKSGGPRIANAVRLELDVPADVAPQEALDAARELAASSPWAVLGVMPLARLISSAERTAIEIEAYAIDREATADLLADLVTGWRARRERKIA